MRDQTEVEIHFLDAMHTTDSGNASTLKAFDIQTSVNIIKIGQTISSFYSTYSSVLAEL